MIRVVDLENYAYRHTIIYRELIFIGKEQEMFVKHLCPIPKHPSIGFTFDLDLWPTDLNINRNHLLTNDYLPTKFEAHGAKHSWVIPCIRCWRLTYQLSNIPTNTSCAKQYAHLDYFFIQGGINWLFLKHGSCSRPISQQKHSYDAYMYPKTSNCQYICTLCPFHSCLSGFLEHRHKVKGPSLLLRGWNRRKKTSS